MQWDWQAIGTIVAIAAVAVTLIFNLVSLRLTRAGQRLIELGQQQDREMAEATAQRSEAAARLTEGSHSPASGVGQHDCPRSCGRWIITSGIPTV